MSVPNCFECGKTIDDYVYKIIAFDRPHVNLYFHKECYITGDIEEYFANKKERVYNYAEPPAKTNKNS